MRIVRDPQTGRQMIAGNRAIKRTINMVFHTQRPAHEFPSAPVHRPAGKPAIAVMGASHFDCGVGVLN